MLRTHVHEREKGGLYASCETCRRSADQAIIKVQPFTPSPLFAVWNEHHGIASKIVRDLRGKVTSHKVHLYIVNRLDWLVWLDIIKGPAILRQPCP